jgi:hypothetical protein
MAEGTEIHAAEDAIRRDLSAFCLERIGEPERELLPGYVAGSHTGSYKSGHLLIKSLPGHARQR